MSAVKAAKRATAAKQSSGNKTRPTSATVGRFLEGIEDDAVRVDCLALVQMMRAASGREPVMWGSSMVGFGSYHYVYESGREGDMFLIGFSPRKRNIALYLAGGVGLFAEELAELGKHETGKGCLYIRSLADVDGKTLKAILAKSWREGAERIAVTA